MEMNFGRFTDAFRKKPYADKWTECEKLYNEKKYGESYKIFFDYLKDPEIENVFYTVENDSIKFQLIQGSKEIRGYFDGTKITAISVIAEYDKINIAVFRRLMEMNYSLYYSRFAVKDNRIVIKFDSSAPACSPNKLYYGLKELSTRADRQDDTLISEFKTLKEVDLKSESYPKQTLEVMIKYYRKWIKECLEKTAGLNKEQYSGAISYMYLNLLYKIDYLLVPQGVVLNNILNISWNYFNDKNSSIVQKVGIMEVEIKKLDDYDDSQLEKNFYRVKCTFAGVPPAFKQAVDDTITNNIGNTKWYIENNQGEIALNILEYICGYSLFTYGLNVSLRKLLGLILGVINNDFVTAAGYDNEMTSNGVLNKAFIEKKTAEYIAQDTEEYPELKINYDKLKYDSVFSFAKSMLEEILTLNYKN